MVGTSLSPYSNRWRGAMGSRKTRAKANFLVSFACLMNLDVRGKDFACSKNAENVPITGTSQGSPFVQACEIGKVCVDFPSCVADDTCTGIAALAQRIVMAQSTSSIEPAEGAEAAP